MKWSVQTETYSLLLDPLSEDEKGESTIRGDSW